MTAVVGRIVAVGLVLLLLMGAWFYYARGPGEASPLDRAVAFVRRTSSQQYLETQTAFLRLEGGHKPSDWLAFYFSGLSTAGWLSEDDPEAKDVPWMVPVMPRGVRLVPHRVDPDAGRQIVIQADDARWMIVVLAYEDPAAPPGRREEWAFPRFP
jgi:hypothetical protein